MFSQPPPHDLTVIMLVLCFWSSWSEGPSACQRVHFIVGFKNAVKWATLFSFVCHQRRFQNFLEAEAYASYMKGILLFEQDMGWDTALMNFKLARAVYEELGEYGDVEN